MFRRCLFILSALLLAALACSTSEILGESPNESVSQTYTPHISVYPFGAPPGTTHQVELTGFPPDSEIFVFFTQEGVNGQLDSFNVQVDSTGFANFTYTTSPDSEFGTYFFEANSSSLNSTVRGQVVLAPEDTGEFPDIQQPSDDQQQPPPQSYSPGVNVLPPSGPPTTRHALIFAGFPANASLTVNFYNPSNALVYTFDSSTGPDGNGEAWLQTGSDTAPGNYLLEVIGPGNAYATFTIQVTGSSPPPNTGNGSSYEEFNGVMNALVLNLSVYWSLNFSNTWPEYQNQFIIPEVYAYQPPASLEGCTTPPEKTYNNAFYCIRVNRIYYDENWLKTNYDLYGSVFPAYIVAHEWAHAVQDMLGIFQENTLSINVELQADCFTGNYFAWGEEKGYFTLADISNVAYTIIPQELAESHWTWTGDTAHGGSLRTGVFGQGYANDIDYCKDYKAFTP